MQLEVDLGVSLHVQLLGPAAPPLEEALPPVVMLHGLVGNMTTWYFSAAPELAKTRRVVLVDLRGHGLSTRAARGYDIATMTLDLGKIVDACAGGGPVALVGHSYGAAIAIAFTLANPAKVGRLVAVEAALPPSRLAELDGFYGKPLEQVLARMPDMLKDMVVGHGRREKRFYETLRFLSHDSTLLADLRRAEDIPDAALATLACPVLAVYGRHSSCLPVGGRLARVAPRGRLVELEGGHLLPLEAPKPLTRAIQAFLADDEARG
jgi:pimeloyl-ACP methyl ester carboxylesterase